MDKNNILAKLGLDRYQVKEIPPVVFEGFVYSDARSGKLFNLC